MQIEVVTLFLVIEVVVFSEMTGYKLNLRIESALSPLWFFFGFSNHVYTAKYKKGE